MTVTWHELKYILISSILLFLSFPFFKTGFLSLIAIIPILILLEDQKSLSYAAKIGYWFGLLFNAFIIHWIANNTLIATIVIVVLNSFHYLLIFFLFMLIKNRISGMAAIFSLPFVWTFLDWLREFGDLKFNWLNLAHTFTYYQPIIQFIDITGYTGLSFVIILTNVLLYVLWKYSEKYKRLAVSILVIVWGVILIYSIPRYISVKNSQKTFDKIKAGYLQPNIDPWLKWEPKLQQMSVDALFDGTHQLIKDSVDLIIWPETATPFYLRQRGSVINKIQFLTRKHDFYLLTGTLDYQFVNKKKNIYKVFNSAFLFGGDYFPFIKYDKINLVPGAEKIPFESILGHLNRYIDVGQGNFTEGNEATIFRLSFEEKKKSEAMLGVGICYDSVFPELFRDFIKNGANLFSIITNDGWFGKTTGPYQHKQIAVLRAIEFKRSIVRCANTGISCFIEPDGSVYNSSQLETFAFASRNIPLNREVTLFARFGPVLPVFSGIVTIIMLCLSVWRQKQIVQTDD